MRSLALLVVLWTTSATVEAQGLDPSPSRHERLATFTAGGSITCTAVSVLSLAVWQWLEADRSLGLDALGHTVVGGLLGVASSLIGAVGLITLGVGVSLALEAGSRARRGPAVLVDRGTASLRLRLEL